MLNRLRFPSIWFLTASLLGLLQVYYAIRGGGWRLSLSALAYGLVLGFGVQLFIRKPLASLAGLLRKACANRKTA